MIDLYSRPEPLAESEIEYVLAILERAGARQYSAEMAERYYKRSLDLDTEYSRAHAGIAAVRYLLALETFETTKDRQDIDGELVRQAIESYTRARHAANQPPLSDIPVKVHFGLGQCYLLQVYGGSESVFDSAIAEFQAVIAAYGNGEQSRLRVMAAESHGALGLIYELSGQLHPASQEYRLAASLLDDDPERQQFFKEQADQLE